MCYAEHAPRLFLRRNINRAILTNPDARVDHLASFTIRNGLESKLKQDESATAAGPGTGATSRKATQPRRFCYKINFVLDTEDATIRSKLLSRRVPPTAAGGVGGISGVGGTCGVGVDSVLPATRRKLAALGKFRRYWDAITMRVLQARPDLAADMIFWQPHH